MAVRRYFLVAGVIGALFCFEWWQSRPYVSQMGAHDLLFSDMRQIAAALACMAGTIGGMRLKEHGHLKVLRTYAACLVSLLFIVRIGQARGNVWLTLTSDALFWIACLGGASILAISFLIDDRRKNAQAQHP